MRSFLRFIPTPLSIKTDCPYLCQVILLNIYYGYYSSMQDADLLWRSEDSFGESLLTFHLAAGSPLFPLL